MNAVINAAFQRSRTILLLFLVILVAGSLAWVSIPKESEPDIAIPIIYVSMNHDGISPEDAERLLVRPMEQELQSIEGVKTMTSTAGEGHASVMLEFFAGFDSKRALEDVREKVDTAKSRLPAATDEPSVNEINVALFPVLTVSLSGSIPERSLVALARDLKEHIETLPGVLEADIGGDREALMEVVVDPAVMETYGVSYSEIYNLIRNNNLLVAAGAMDTGAGRLVIKVPGVVEDAEDVLGMPVKVDGSRVVVFGDVASIRRGFKDPESFARVDGQPAVTLEVKKRVGANIIDTIAEVRAIVEQERQHWPDAVEVSYMQDKSDDIRTMLSDLQNNILSAILLVMIVILAALGPRSALLVGLAIPGSFLATVAILQMFGLTLNIVVLFSLILVVGMLVDGAVIVTELADRNLGAGMSPVEAFRAASRRMSWPVAASTLTTLAVFFPLLFWPGVVGEFMKFLPITVIVALSSSLLMALVFIPVLGSGISRHGNSGNAGSASPSLVARGYGSLLGALLRHPGKTLVVALLVITGTYVGYSKFGHGVEFFPDVEPEFAQIQVHARGDLSIHEKDAIVRQVEQRILGSPELASVYARSFNTSSGENLAEDVIGVIHLEFVDWDRRRPANEILDEFRATTEDIPGVVLEFRKAENGPSGGKPIQIEVSARDTERITATVNAVREIMDGIGGYADTEDDRPLPGIEWRLEVDRERAAQYGTDVATLGNAVQLITTGLKVSEYRPDDSNDEVDIRVRFPYAERNLGQLDQLRVQTRSGMVPITNFVSVNPAPRTGTLKRVDGQRVITVQSDVEEGLLVDAQTTLLRQALLEAAGDLDPTVSVNFKGEDADQKEAAEFLMGAFLSAIMLMALILVTMFNRIYQALLVLSAIVFSTAGVLIGLLLTAQPFGIVMVGLGIIALAGIVVNNNIVLIDTYNRMRDDGLDSYEAALETGKLRLRPVFLTAFTTVLGLMPMVLAMNIDLLGRDIAFGSPSTQWWTQLSSAIAGGLSFATLLTLLLTPALLVLGDNTGRWLRSRLRFRSRRPARDGEPVSG